MNKLRNAKDASDVKDTLVRLLSVARGSDFTFPEEMLKEIEAISIEGVDPKWQISEIKKILDRWARRH